MPVDLRPHLPADPSAAARAALTPTAAAMQGSMILQIAAEVRALQAAGAAVADLTVGDFKPAQFPIPAALADRVVHHLRAGETNYPPSDGVPALKKAISAMVSREWGFDYGGECVVVASGARPPIYAAWRLLVSPGDRTCSFLPMWNTGYYAQLLQADHRFIQTSPEHNFFPTVEQFRDAIRGARLVVLNSPLNPTGTVVDPEVLRGYARALIDENVGRERPCILLFDQVYWRLTLGGRAHANPVALEPACAPYVIHVDAVSKWMAATGLRVGWAVVPPHLQGPMKNLLGHIGAWAPRAEQLAVADLLADPASFADYEAGLIGAIGQRLRRLYDGIQALAAEGLPVGAIEPQGGIYLSLRVDLIGRGFSRNEDIRRFLLERAGVAVVPFQAFDMAEESGWFRMSVGSVSLDDIDGALGRLGYALREMPSPGRSA